jgi:hypothetical protein
MRDLGEVNDMKKWAAFAGIAFALVSCGLLDRKIEFGGSGDLDIKIPGTANNNGGKDAFFLSGRNAKINLSNAGLVVQNARTQAEKTWTTAGEFDDVTINIPSGLSIKEFNYAIPFESAAVLENNAACPTSFTLSNIMANIKVADATSNTTVTLIPKPTSATFTQTTTACNYTFNLALNVSLKDPQLKTLIDVVSKGGANTATFELKFTYDGVTGDLGLKTGGATTYIIGGPTGL